MCQVGTLTFLRKFPEGSSHEGSVAGHIVRAKSHRVLMAARQRAPTPHKSGGQVRLEGRETPWGAFPGATKSILARRDAAEAYSSERSPRRAKAGGTPNQNVAGHSIDNYERIPQPTESLKKLKGRFAFDYIPADTFRTPPTDTFRHPAYQKWGNVLRGTGDIPFLPLFCRQKETKGRGRLAERFFFPYRFWR